MPPVAAPPTSVHERKSGLARLAACLPAGPALVGWLLLLVGAAAIYLPGLNNALLFDDERLRDTVFSGYATLQLKERMLSYGSFVWLRNLLGDSWPFQRVVNLLIHFGVVVVLYRFTRLMMDQVSWPEAEEAARDPSWLPRSKDAAALFGVAVFALNPVAVYAVAYLIQRSILMATLFSVLALYAVARAGGSRGGALLGWLLAGLLAYILALFSKEHAVMLPAAALAVFFIVRKPGRQQLVGTLLLAALLLAAAIVLLHGRHAYLVGQVFDAASRDYLAQLASLQPGVEGKAWPLSILNQSWLYFKYGALWILPNPGWLSLDLRPVFPVSLATFPQVLGGAGFPALLLASLWLMIRYADWKRFLGLALFMPAILFVTEFATVWIQDPFVLYRSYLWAIGIPLLAGMVWVGSSTKIVRWGVAIIAVILAGLAVERVQTFRSEETAWGDAARKIDLSAPAAAVGRWRPLVNHGNQLLHQEQYQQAAQWYEAAAKTGEVTGIADYHLGLALLKLDQHQRAFEALDRAERRVLYATRHPGMIPFYKGQVLFNAGRHELAVQWLNQALLQLTDGEIWLAALETRAKAFIKLARFQDAIADYTALARLVPGDRKSQIGLAMALNAGGQHAQARALLDGLVRENDSPDVRAARIIVMLAARQPAEARTELQAALLRYPGNPTLQKLARQLGL